MKNSLMLNNFLHEQPPTAHVHENGKGSRQSLGLDLNASRQSSDFPSSAESSARFTNRMKSKLLKNSARSSMCSENLESDEDISISDLEDDYVDSRFNSKGNNYWANLDDSIKKINDDTDKFALKPRPNFKSSVLFKDVMTDMSGNVEYGVSKGYTLLKQKISRLTNVTLLTAKALSTSMTSEPEEKEESKNDQSDSDEEITTATKQEKEKELVSSVGGAKRAWRVLKTHVNETGHENRTTTVKMNWEALRHHVSGITDLDRARQDLYERYGLLPTVQEDGSKVCRNIMWVNRTRAQIMQNDSNNLLRGKLRAQSARPFTAQRTDRNRNFSGNNTHSRRPVSCDIHVPYETSRPTVRPSSEKRTKFRLRPTSVKSKNTY